MNNVKLADMMRVQNCQVKESGYVDVSDMQTRWMDQALKQQQADQEKISRDNNTK